MNRGGRAPGGLPDALRGKTVMLIPGMHPDWAWGHTRLWHARRYVESLERALALLDGDERFCWYIECYKTEFEPFLLARPALVEKLGEYVRRGRVDICGGYANVRPNMVGDEAFIRNMTIGMRKFAEALPGVEFNVHAESVDVSAGHPQMPQLLRKAGWRYFRFGRPYGILTRRGIPREFVWEGLDGSRILASWGNYSGLHTREASRLDFKSKRDEALAWLYDHELKELLETTGADVLWLPIGSDDNYPLCTWHGLPVDVSGMLEEYNRLPGMRMELSTPAGYFAALEKQKDALRTVKGSLDPCDVCYNAAWNGEKGLAPLRAAGDYEIVQCEKWQAVAALRGCCEAVDTQALWEDNLTASAHATQWLFLQDAREIREMAQRCILEARRINRRALARLAESIRPAEGTHAVVFNPVCLPRKAFVRLTVPCSGEPTELRDGSGKAVPFQVLREYVNDGMLFEQELLAELELPSMGYNTVAANTGTSGREAPGGSLRAPERRKVEPRMRLRSDRLALELEFGRIACVEDLASGIKRNAGSGTGWNGISLSAVDACKGELLAGPVVSVQDAQWREYAVLDAGPLLWRLRLWGCVGEMPLRQDIELYAGESAVHFTVETDWKKHSGYLCAEMPAAPGCWLAGGIPFGIEEKPVQTEPYCGDMHRQRPGMFFAKDFALCRSDGRWEAFVAPNSDRYYILDADRGALQYMLINSIVLEDLPGVDLELANAETFEGLGIHRFEYALAFGSGDGYAGEIQRMALLLRGKPEIVYAGKTYKLHGEGKGSFVSLSRGLVLSAMYFEEEALNIRVWEYLGREGDAWVRLDAGGMPSRAEAVDFHGNPCPEKEVSVTGPVLSFRTVPHEIVTLKCIPGRANGLRNHRTAFRRVL